MAVVELVGFVLVGIGSIAGAVLLFKAMAGKLNNNDANGGTLWGLFILGLGGGLAIMEFLGRGWYR